jgi:hypothetical protein
MANEEDPQPVVCVDGCFLHPDRQRARCLSGRAPNCTEAEVRLCFDTDAPILERGDAIAALSETAREWLFPRECRVCGADHASEARLFLNFARRIPRMQPDDPETPSEVRQALAPLGIRAHRKTAQIAREGERAGKSARAIYYDQLLFARSYRLRVESDPRLRLTMKGTKAR